MTPLNAREWLEALRAANGPEADFAAELLDTWCPEDEIEEHETVKDANHAALQSEEDLSVIESVLIESPFASEFVTTGHDETSDELRAFLKYVTDQDAQLEAVRQVLIDGGVLRERDGLDDLAGVIAMFVPPVAVEAG